MRHAFVLRDAACFSPYLETLNANGYAGKCTHHDREAIVNACTFHSPFLDLRILNVNRFLKFLHVLYDELMRSWVNEKWILTSFYFAHSTIQCRNFFFSEFSFHEVLI